MRKNRRIGRSRLLTILYVGIPTAALAVAALIWGKELSDLIRVVLKLAVKA